MALTGPVGLLFPGHLLRQRQDPLVNVCVSNDEATVPAQIAAGAKVNGPAVEVRGLAAHLCVDELRAGVVPDARLAPGFLL